MAWHIEILKIELEEQLLINYCMIKHLTLLIPKYDGYQHGLASVVYKCFDKTNFLWNCYACMVGDVSYAK